MICDASKEEQQLTGVHHMVVEMRVVCPQAFTKIFQKQVGMDYWKEIDSQT